MYLYKRAHHTALPGEPYIYKRNKSLTYIKPKSLAEHFEARHVIVSEDVGLYCTIDLDLQDHTNEVSALIGTPVSEEVVQDMHQRNEWLRAERDFDMQFELIDAQAETYELLAKMAASPGDADVYAEVASDLAVVKYKWLTSCEYKFLTRFFITHPDVHSQYPDLPGIEAGFGWSPIKHYIVHQRAAAIIHYCRMEGDTNPIPAGESRKKKGETDEAAMARRIYESFEFELSQWRGIVTKWAFIEKSHFWNEHYAWDMKALQRIRNEWIGDAKSEYTLDPDPGADDSAGE